MGLFVGDAEPSKIFVGDTPISKVFLGDTQIRPSKVPALCFTANTAGSTVQLTKSGSPTVVTLEISTDGTNWTTYTIGNTITLSNIGDKVYWRNTSETDTGFSKGVSSYYKFVMSGSVAGRGDVNYLLNKNSTTTLSSSNCYRNLFSGCTALTSAPSLPATTITSSCYRDMFNGCTSLVTLPELPARTLMAYCCNGMFNGCSSIKISQTKTGDYQTEYIIPTSGNGTTASSWNTNMFANTGGTFVGTPSINTTYYLHKDNTIV